MEVPQQLADVEDLGLQVLDDGGCLRRGVPQFAELLGASGKERLHCGSGLADRAAMRSEPRSGLSD
eukprot:1129715-Alexandrium_andersonii.AAC.1